MALLQKYPCLALLALWLQVAACADCDVLDGWYGGKDIGVCYNLGHLTDFTAPNMDWFAAGPYCEELREGASLARITNQAQQDLIRVTLGNVGPVLVWTAGNDLNSPSHFQWDYDLGEYVEEDGFFAWAYKQPYNESPGEECIALRNEQDYRWVSTLCDRELDRIPLCQYTP